MSDTPQFAPKSFLSRPEGKTGIIIPVIAATVLLFFFGSQIADYIVHALDNMLHMLIVATSTLALLFVLLDPKLRALVFYIYRSLCRWLTGLFINIDPIGVMKTYKERLQEKLNEMDNSIKDLDGQRDKVARIIDHNKSEIDRSMRLVEQAVKTGDATNQALEGRQAARLTTENEHITQDLNKINFLLQVLNKARSVANFNLIDIGREIDSRERERNYSRGARGAVRAALGILKGIPNEKDLYDESLERAEQQYTQAMGEVDHFLDVTKDAMGAASLQDSADQEQAMLMLKEWQSRNDTSLRLTLPAPPVKEAVAITAGK